MSIHLPSKRIASLAPSSFPGLSATTTTRRTLLPLSQRRSAWSLPDWFKRRRGGASNDHSHSASGGQNLDDPKVRQRVLSQQSEPVLTDSIFEDEVKEANKNRTAASNTSTQTAPAEAGIFRTDPDPRSRIRWERKKVIQMVRRQTAGQEPSEWVRRAERIAHTEHQLTHKSPMLETSVKKLVMLARQIRGKTLEDALLQMQYSKKKMAAEVKYQLEEARDLAIVSRGMGLGKVGASAAEGRAEAPGNAKAAPIKIKTKDGQTLKITDPSSMYISEAWVGKGTPRFRAVEYKGRGRTGFRVSPATSITVVLKEEKTRLRQHNESVAKEAKRKPWVHLPDRPVTAQRPYYSW